MRPVVLHPGSLAIGVVAAGACMLVASAQAPQVESTLHPAPRKVEMHIVGIPDPNDMVMIKSESGAYTVPPGKIFTLTGVGTLEGGWKATVTIDGIGVASREQNFGSPTQPFSTISPVPPGITAQPGHVVEIVVASGAGRATGYLVDVRP